MARLGRNAATLAFFIAFGEGLISAQTAPDAIVKRSRRTGDVTQVTASGGGVHATPAEPMRVYGAWFGVTDADAQLKAGRSTVDLVRGDRHTTFEQVHHGVPVFAGVLKLHQDERGRFISINGRFRKIPDTLELVARIAPDQALTAARAEVPGLPVVASPPTLTIVDPGWYGDPPRGARLAYEFSLSDENMARAQVFFVDAATGEILDDWSLNHEALSRRVFDGGGGPTLGTLVRSEGEPPVAAPAEANFAYDYSGDVHGYLLRAFGYDSIDDQGIELVSLVNSTAPAPCPNAFWTPFLEQTVFCSGLVTDDILAHEFTHGLTRFSADLINQNQSGQLNESFSDVFGELVDLFNGDAGFVGPPSGNPWPEDHPTGSGNDLPNAARTDECTIGVAMRVNSPPDIAGVYVALAVDRLGPRLSAAGVTGELALTIPADACPAGTPLSNPAQVNGKIAVINVETRSDCTVVSQATNAQDAGAIAVLILAVAPTFPPSLSGIDNRIGIPLATLDVEDGNRLKAALAVGPVNVTLFANTAGASVRWLLGEDSSIGIGRDMWNPRCFFHPDSANHPYNTCPESDNGGVHFGSGVPNHAFALATDGGSFRDFTVEGIGPIKAGAVWFRALTVYLTPASDFEDAFTALTQSANDLVGTFPNDPRTGMPSSDMFTSADAESIETALRAVELDTPGRCGGGDELLSASAPPICAGSTTIFADDFESNAPGWTVSNTGPSGPPTPYDWILTDSALPFDRPGRARFVDNSFLGDCVADESAVHSLTSPPIQIPLDAISPRAAFTHFMESEGGFDGGNVKVCIVGGICRLVPRTAFQFNPYNGRLFTPAQGNVNPFAGQAAWTGAGGQWGTSIFSLDGLVTPGDTVTLRFDFAKDQCFGVTGWYVDDLLVYDCPDCDNDGTSDHDEARFAAASDILSNIGTGVPQSLLLNAPPQARGDVTLRFTAQGDFRNTAEFADIDINGTPVGAVFVNHASDCNPTPDEETLTVPATLFNQAIGAANAVIRINPSVEVSPTNLCEGITYATIFVEYASASLGDANENGLPDACEGDLDADGDVDLRDTAAFLSCFTGPFVPVTGKCQTADLDSDSDADRSDFARLAGSMSGPR